MLRRVAPGAGPDAALTAVTHVYNSPDTLRRRFLDEWLSDAIIFSTPQPDFMATLLKLRLGVSDDPNALQPNLNDCLAAMLQHAEVLMADVLAGLGAAASPTGAKKVAALQNESIQQAVRDLTVRARAVSETYKTELTRIVYEGGGKEQVHGEVLHFEDLQLFDDAELDQSIEVARAQQEVSLSVDDVLPALDALISTLLGWRTIQSGLNPLRPDVFVRAFQACLSAHVPDAQVRDALIAPSAGLLGVNLRRLYRELSDWLRSCGIEPAVPVGGRLYKGGGATGKTATDTVAKTMLTLDRLRHLLAGDFDPPKANDHLYTVPASMAMLQDMKQVDALMQRLESRPKSDATESAVPEGSGELPAMVAADEPASPRLGHQLGHEVVRLMFDNLAQDRRLMPEFQRQLKAMEPAVFILAQHDSRFFSDRTHPARQFLDRITQRSLAFSSTSDDGWRRFLATVEDAVKWLDSKVVDAEVFGELIDNLQTQWAGHDKVLHSRREEAARALLHAEQRNLLAQNLADEFARSIEQHDVAGFAAEFLKGSWAQVVAEAQLSCADGSDDPYGYRAVVPQLIWSVQKSTATRGRNKRLAEMIPGLLVTLREGLERIHYPPELTTHFFDKLITLHQATLDAGELAQERLRQGAQAAKAANNTLPEKDGQADAGAKAQADAGTDDVEDDFFDDSQAAFNVEVVEVFDLDPAAPVQPLAEPGPGAQRHEAPYVDEQEAQESGYLDEDSYLPEDLSELPGQAAEDLSEPVGAAELRTGTWLELMVNGSWLRVQLTWASPHATLFMFTSLAGSAHSMSRRTLERLRAQGMMKVVADRTVVDDAFDQVANAALKNSLKSRS